MWKTLDNFIDDPESEGLRLLLIEDATHVTAIYEDASSHELRVIGGEWQHVEKKEC